MVDAFASAFARWRRRHPPASRRLRHPVISIGNIAVGGRAKTPMTRLVADALLAAGERPAILSRGYGRARRHESPVIVRDVAAVRAGVLDAGDEPLMLAERLDGAIVVVHEDRARAGVVAETLGATVHVLDDGFQHLQLARDMDIVMVESTDRNERMLPGGRLREPIDALSYADGICIVRRADDEDAALSQWRERLAQAPGVRVFSVERRTAGPDAAEANDPVMVVTGLADGRQFTAGARAAGWRVVGERHFGDHRRYSAGDAAAVARDASAAGATAVLTSAKDAVRLRDHWVSPLPLRLAELTLALDLQDAFEAWLLAGVRAARDASDEFARRARQEGARRVG